MAIIARHKHYGILVNCIEIMFFDILKITNIKVKDSTLDKAIKQTTKKSA